MFLICRLIQQIFEDRCALEGAQIQSQKTQSDIKAKHFLNLTLKLVMYNKGIIMRPPSQGRCEDNMRFVVKAHCKL